MTATRIKIYGPNFGLYKLDSTKGIRIMDAIGKDIAPITFNGIIGVDERHFVGFAKGKTGAHKLNAPNTETIDVMVVRYENGKYSAARWVLCNQGAVDRTYQQEKAFNI